MSIYNRLIDMQTLNIAWDRVRRNKPAAGVDGMTYEQYHEQRKEQNKQLQLELEGHSYEACPVKQVTLYKGEKARTLALYCMRDKVVQQALAAVLAEIYEPGFSDSTVAYRPKHSARTVIEQIDEKVAKEGYRYYIKADIRNYFDNIRWDLLRSMLARDIREEDVLELVRMNCCGRILDPDTGDLNDLRCGIHQGSGIAPVLSNVYLMDFDAWLAGQSFYYVRYSDDLLILAREDGALANTLQEMASRLSQLGLTLNDKKTGIGQTAKGFDFLGYHFDSSGKAIPAAAEQNLDERLETMWLTSGDIGFSAKCRKVLEIIGGWEQYFKEDRKPGSILEYAALVYSANRDTEMLRALQDQRSRLDNMYLDVCSFLAETWRKTEREDLELLEYEQFFQMPQMTPAQEAAAHPAWQELLAAYRRFLIYEERDTAVELMQIYADIKGYRNAWKWQGKITELEHRKPLPPSVFAPGAAGTGELIMNEQSPGRILELFAGREDIYALDSLDQRRSRRVEQQPMPLLEQVVRDHLAGRKNVATYVQRPNATVHFMVFDIDISKRVLIGGIDRKSDMFAAYMKKALDTAVQLLRELRSMGMNGYIEYSGCRGYHVWLFFDTWVPTRFANMFEDVIADRMKLPDGADVTLEFFPNKTKVRQGKPGQTIRLPFGFHVKTGERSYFLNESLEPVSDINGFMDCAARASQKTLKRALAACAGGDGAGTGAGTGAGDGVGTTPRQAFVPDVEKYGSIPDSVKTVLERCSLMDYLCGKALRTSYLTHFERLSVLYVFGHLGDEGKAFVHQVMAYTLNYKHGVTQRFIDRLPEKPVSCIKLREQYKTITAEYGCSCVFKNRKQCYPSPVLHAITSSVDAAQGSVSVTLPISQTLTKEKTQKVISEINVGSNLSALVNEFMKLRRQRREQDRAIARVEKQLASIFDEMGSDCVETEAGMLTRRKADGGGYSWAIEL